MGAVPLPSIAIPGQRLADSSSYISGPGTYIRDNSIYASIPGPIVIQEPVATDPKSKKTRVVTVSRSSTPSTSTIKSPSQPQGLALLGSSNRRIPLKFNTLPTVGSIVLGRVTRVQRRQATISILLVLPENQQLNPSADDSEDPSDADLPSILASASISTTSDSLNADELRPQALIRKEDVRAVEKDRVVMEESFRVGDIVRAVIVSVGDQVAYYASTAGNELGVVMARSSTVESGVGMEGFGGNMMFPVSWKEMRDPVTGRGEMRKVAKPF
ncbi:exosome 3'-_5 exonuclease subunit ski4 (Csl4) [Coccidioides immitis]|nr:exosome 3'->5 exonuclease subunit ski4 (Csl4) [Coccidioides immitis]